MQWLQVRPLFEWKKNCRYPCFGYIQCRNLVYRRLCRHRTKLREPCRRWSRQPELSKALNQMKDELRVARSVRNCLVERDIEPKIKNNTKKSQKNRTDFENVPLKIFFEKKFVVPRFSSGF